MLGQVKALINKENATWEQRELRKNLLSRICILSNCTKFSFLWIRRNKFINSIYIGNKPKNIRKKGRSEFAFLQAIHRIDYVNLRGPFLAGHPIFKTVSMNLFSTEPTFRYHGILKSRGLIIMRLQKSS